MIKLFLILVAALVLGGCTLGSTMFKQSATDEASSTPVPTPVSSVVTDEELESIPSTKSDTDAASIEADLNATSILEEDFSDLE